MLSSHSIEKMRVDKFSISTSLLIRAAQEKDLQCTFLPEKVVLISNGKTSYYFKGTNIPCNNAVAASLAHNKYFLRRLLTARNIPTPNTIALRHPAAWQSVLTSSLHSPLVVKPINASHANGASLNIQTPGELHQAVKRAFAYMRKHTKGNRVLIEEFFEAHDLRFLVVGTKVVSVIKREPAYVIGDGHSALRELVHKFNRQWRSSIKYDFPMCPIRIDSEVSRHLAKSNLTLSSVMPTKKKVSLRWNANVSTGGRPIDITDQVHPRIKSLAIQIAKVSQLNVGGVDVLCKDPTLADISPANVSVLEINGAPGLDIHHIPYKGMGRNVSADILDYIFGEDRKSAKEPRRIEALLENIDFKPHAADISTPLSPPINS